MTLPTLIDILREAEAPSRELDEAICEALMGWPEPEWRSIDYMKTFGLPVTSSVDAAIKLAAKVLPDMNCWGIDKDERSVQAHVQRNGVKSGHWAQFAEHQVPAIALVLASLKALSAQKQGGE